MQVLLIIVIIILLIWVFVSRSNLENKEIHRQISGKLRAKYPNFVNTIKVTFQTDAMLDTDNNTALCYKIPISTFGRKTGEMYYSIIDTINSDNKPYIMQSYIGFDGVEINTKRYYLKNAIDLEIDNYIEIFDDLANEIIMDSRYLHSISKI